MHRRSFLAYVIAAVITGRESLSSASEADAVPLSPAEVIPLWNGTPPGGGGPDGRLISSAGGALSHIAHPTLSVYSPARSNGYAVLIAAGGGYKRIEMRKEALPAAAWLTARGFTAYVLTYRLPDEGWGEGSLVALQDAQRALRVIRQREKHLSVLGFSAGGHLLGLAAVRSDFVSYPPTDAIDTLPAKADRAALIYPVITLEPPYTHTSTHRILAGTGASLRQDAQWSVQNFVTPQSPPFFLVQAKDDPVSDPENTLIMQAACQREHVPVELFRYSRGGHGFGMGKPGTPTVEWPAHYAQWLAAWRRAEN
ncbi:alpha/beta hydrolase [Tatumella sp. JGM118]|uniref:alpha/beta hydrolase n=1 Tax=Tatumella sp. JGM118 TaxID=2799796 RepID=UPI001BB0C296|nr:alpha/beta hydrolase [Tatumella sp. JGM118]MBS0908272.1 alpha/beta hydrolase [Tatumella sp. JGM118]